MIVIDENYTILQNGKKESYKRNSRKGKVALL